MYPRALHGTDRQTGRRGSMRNWRPKAGLLIISFCFFVTDLCFLCHSS